MDRSLPQVPPRPPKFSDLTPEEQQALLAQGWTAAEDGSLTPPADAGGGAMPEPLPAPPPSSFPDAGGFGAAPGGFPATAPPAAPTPPSLPIVGSDPSGAASNTLNARVEFGGPQFDTGNPMQDAAPKPFDAPKVTPPLMAQPDSGIASVKGQYGDKSTGSGASRAKGFQSRFRGSSRNNSSSTSSPRGKR